MKVSVEKLPTSEAVLDIELTWEEMEKASDKAYRKLVKQVDIQGFRRGKAPRALVERRLGRETIYQEGLDDLITDAYRDAIREHSLTPITQPKLDAPVFEMGQPYHFSLTVPIVTAPVLGDYKSLHFERPEATVTSEEVEKELESQRTRQTEWTVVERPAVMGDRVTVDLLLTSEGQQISNLKDNPFELTDDRSGLFTGMDEQVVGMQPGEQKTFSTTIPESYSSEKYRGKQADFDITLHKIEEKHVPELDDAFAEKVSEGQYTSMEDLRKSLSDNILENKKRANRDELREKVVQGVIEQAQLSLHPTLIDEEAEELLHQMSHMLEEQGLAMEQYLRMTRKTREEYLSEVRPDAESRVKRQLVLNAIVVEEKLEVTPEEVEELYNLYEQMGQPLQRTENSIRAIIASLQREKAVTRLIELTTDPDPDEEQEAALEEEASEENALPAALATERLSEDEMQATEVVDAELSTEAIDSAMNEIAETSNELESTTENTTEGTTEDTGTATTPSTTETQGNEESETPQPDVPIADQTTDQDNQE